jgi:hypothetical protein
VIKQKIAISASIVPLPQSQATKQIGGFPMQGSKTAEATMTSMRAPIPAQDNARKSIGGVSIPDSSLAREIREFVLDIDGRKQNQIFSKPRSSSRSLTRISHMG